MSNSLWRRETRRKIIYRRWLFGCYSLEQQKFWSNESNFWCQRKRFLFSPHFHIQFQNFFMYWCKIYNGVRSERGMQSIKNCGFRKESVLCYGFPCSRFMAVGRGSIFAAGCQDIGIAAAAATASSSLLCERNSDLFWEHHITYLFQATTLWFNSEEGMSIRRQRMSILLPR